MADCSKTEEFLTECNRMCRQNTFCSDCPASTPVRANCYIQKITKKEANGDFFSKIISIVQKWSDTHPAPKPKTYTDVFFEHFPTASKDDACMPFICRENIFGTGYGGCNYAGYDCRACWNEPYPEQEVSNG